MKPKTTTALSSQQIKQAKTTALVEAARRAYEKHEIRDRGDRWWHIARRYPDGDRSFDSSYVTDIFCGRLGEVYVGGDISSMVFAYNNANPISRLHWIGDCNDLEYYVAQKASIGMGRDLQNAVWDYDSELAATQLHEHYQQLLDAGRSATPPAMKDLKDILLELGLELPQERAVELTHELDWTIMEGLGPLGEVVSTRLVYAWAAIRRLCEVLGAVTRGSLCRTDQVHGDVCLMCREAK